MRSALANLVFTPLLPPACRPGTYKASATDAYCNKCPAHSSSPQEQAVECTCEKGFYRAEADPRAMACTRESCQHTLLLRAKVFPVFESGTFVYLCHENTA